ncbi:MAG: PilZ domain-containing protein, partial [Deltaproteobacteria bacterium]|nr:PilZ domain-containing protein [Deltaproteobacteria bacterium]
MAQARISIAKKKSKNPSHSKPAMKKKAVVQEDTKAAKKLAKIAKTSPSKKTLQASSVAATLLPLSEPAPKSIITKPAVVPEPLKIKSIGKNNTANGRRRSVRFAIMQRVDYKIGDRSTFNYSSNLSASGLFIRGATKFKVGEQISIKLHLNRKDPPLFIRCIVRRIKEDGDEAGAGLEFIEEQDKAFSRIRQFIEEELIKKIEANLQRSITNTNNLILLATYYFEIGRIDDALSLYRRGIETNPTNQQILERAIGVFIPAVRLRGLHGWQLLVELEKILASAMALGPNSKLKQYQAETIELREQLDRRNREQAQAEAEERKLKQQEYETKLRANIEKEVKNVVEKELALHKRELEHEFAVKQKQAEKELADTYKEIKQERAELEIFATTLKEQETKFKRIQQKLEQRQSRFELEQQEATEKLN